MATASVSAGGPWSLLSERPLLLASVGAALLGFTGLLYRESHATPATATAFRCLYALPLLWALARYERRRGSVWAGSRPLAWLAGFLLAADLVLWLRSVDDIGVGLATVLGNVQLVFVVFASVLWLGQRLTLALALAVCGMGAGVVLIAGVLEGHAYGANPSHGVLLATSAGMLYGGYILLMRQAGGGAATIRPLLHATAAAFVCAVLLGVLLGQLDLRPSWPAHAWLLALALLCQALAWLLLTVPSAALPATVTSYVLALQPISGLIIGVVFLHERPSGAQGAGVIVVVIGFIAAMRLRAEAAAVGADANGELAAKVVSDQ